jgi:hypothetical protein
VCVLYYFSHAKFLTTFIASQWPKVQVRNTF